MDAAVSTAHRLDPRRHDARQALPVAAVLGAGGLTAIAAALGASGSADHPATQALLRGSMVAAPLGVALYAWRVPQHARFARLLLAVGLTSFATTLAESSSPVLYSTGRVAGWTLEVLLVLTLLAFPSGRLSAPVDRWLVAAAATVYVALYLPTLLLAEQFRVPSPYTSCTQGCPDNAFSPFERNASAMDRTMVAAGGILVFGVMLAVLVRLQQRIALAGPRERQLLVPVLAVGMVRVTLAGGAIVGRDLGGTHALGQATSVLIAWATPCIALAFLVGVARSRLFSERALRRLATCVCAGPDVPALQRAFADALGDPSVQVVFPRGGSDHAWMDAEGRDVPTADGSGRALHLVRGRDGVVVAGLVVDGGLAERPELLRAATDLAAVAFDNLRLAAEARAAAREAHESRARIAAAADRERRRIERDLHDGAQQRLVALRIELGLVEDLALTDPERCATRLRELEDDVEEALEELRALAHGVCPPLLTDRGLVEAVRAAAARSPVPAAVEAEVPGRSSPEVESAVYFCVVEALQNVAKHARGARHVVVRLSAGGDGALRFSVRDDGAGAPGGRVSGGRGVTNMHDRAAALGGELRIRSRPGVGTEVCGWVPGVPRHARPEAALGAQAR